MLALYDKLDKDIIRLLSDSNRGAIGDFSLLCEPAKMAIVDELLVMNSSALIPI
jgi:hypothetical protein